MTDTQTIIADYDSAIVAKECELLALKDIVWKLLDNEHRLAEIKLLQKDVRAVDSQVGVLLTTILRDEKLSEFKSEASELCKRARELGSYTKDMSKALADDYAEVKRESDDKKKALLGEIGTLLTIPTFLFGIVKGGFGHGAVTPEQAVEAGFAVSTPIFFRKRIPGAFRAAARAVCATPNAVRAVIQSVRNIPTEMKNSFMLYYLKESIKERVQEGTRFVGWSREMPPPHP